MCRSEAKRELYEHLIELSPDDLHLYSINCNKNTKMFIIINGPHCSFPFDTEASARWMKRPTGWV